MIGFLYFGFGLWFGIRVKDRVRVRVGVLDFF